MNKTAENLDITIDPGVPAEVATNAVKWITDICTWLLSQPQPAGLEGTQPRFSEVKYTVRQHARTFGLRNRDSGAGWLDLGVSEDLKIEIRGDFPSFTVIPTDYETACRANWCYVVAQLLYPQGYFRESFRWEECLGYQLAYLDHMAEGNRAVRSLLDEYEQQQQELAEAERLKKYWAQYPEKRKLSLARQAETRRIKVPSWWYDRYPEQRPDDYEPAECGRRQPVYCQHESPTPLPPAAPREPVPNCKTEQDEKWLTQYNAMYAAAMAVGKAQEESE